MDTNIKCARCERIGYRIFSNNSGEWFCNKKNRFTHPLNPACLQIEPRKMASTSSVNYLAE